MAYCVQVVVRVISIGVACEAPKLTFSPPTLPLAANVTRVMPAAMHTGAYLTLLGSEIHWRLTALGLVASGVYFHSPQLPTALATAASSHTLGAACSTNCVRMPTLSKSKRSVTTIGAGDSG